MPEHWQTLLQAQLPNARSVPPLEHDKLSRDACVAALDAALADIDGPVVLVAHSAGVMITVHWAAQHRRPIHAALLATPPDFDQPLPAGYPDKAALEANGWLPAPRAPCPSAAHGGQPQRPLAATNACAAWPMPAAAWSTWGEVGHLNPAAGYGPWPQATELWAELLADG